MSSNIFLKEDEFYQRDINPIRQWVEQSSFFLSKMTGDSIEKCMDFVARAISDKTICPGAKDPVVHHFIRDDNQDRHRTATQLSTYLRNVVVEDRILAPTGTVYLPPKEKPSFLVSFVEGNVIKRSKAKKDAFVAEVEGNTGLYIRKNNTQANMKLYNNSLSGTFGTTSSVLFNPTGHNTLTSTIRSVSSFGNASNERVIAGNRHFWSKDVVINNLIAVSSNVDRDLLSRVMVKYGLYFPSTSDVMACIRYSSEVYWHDVKAIAEITQLVEKLDDLEKAAFVYNGDLFHLRKHNPEFVRKFITELSTKIVGEIDNPLAEVKKISEEIMNYTHQICFNEAKGNGKKYQQIYEQGNLGTMVLTAKNVERVIQNYKDLIEVVFLTTNIPASTAYIPHMVRKTVVLSDTDSTMFSVGEYVGWYFGRICFSPKAYAVAGAVVFIATQTIAHSLSILSANINVDRSKLHGLQMKPEYTFPVFGLTSVAKHYYTGKNIQEGNVFDKMKPEIKGVHLKNSSSPVDINQDSNNLMMSIIDTVMNDKKISLLDFLKHCADLERKIIGSLLNGEAHYYRKSKVKEPAAYTAEPGKSPYVHHLFWEYVFQEKYGSIAPPPYSVIKIPTILSNATATMKWVNQMQDKTIAAGLVRWLTAFKKVQLPTIYIALPYVEAYGIPNEIKSIIDTKRIALDLINGHRLIGESLSFYMKPNMMFSEMGY